MGNRRRVAATLQSVNAHLAVAIGMLRRLGAPQRLAAFHTLQLRILDQTHAPFDELANGLLAADSTAEIDATVASVGHRFETALLTGEQLAVTYGRLPQRLRDEIRQACPGSSPR